MLGNFGIFFQKISKINWIYTRKKHLRKFPIFWVGKTQIFVPPKKKKKQTTMLIALFSVFLKISWSGNRP
jgi:hypothetical protein